MKTRSDSRPALKLRFRELSPATWSDFESLFGARGACGGCWCMLWRLPRSTFEAQKGDRNRRHMKSLVEAGTPLGVLAYAGKVPVGWCAVAPRQDLPGLGRSRILAPVDPDPVWSVTCFFIARSFRNAGVSQGLLQAAARLAKRRGARLLEGYPQASGGGHKIPDVFAWTGLESAFRKNGFVEVARRAPKRPIMRLPL